MVMYIANYECFLGTEIQFKHLSERENKHSDKNLNVSPSWKSLKQRNYDKTRKKVIVNISHTSPLSSRVAFASLRPLHLSISKARVYLLCLVSDTINLAGVVKVTFSCR